MTTCVATALRELSNEEDPAMKIPRFAMGLPTGCSNGVEAWLFAMTDALSSNSMIESWWKTLKGQWLCLNSLDSIAGVDKLVEFSS